MSDVELVVKIPEETLSIIKSKLYCGIYDPDLYKAVENGIPHQKMGCEGCTYEKTGNNSTYPCSHCGRCYTDKYKEERSDKRYVCPKKKKKSPKIYRN